MLLRRLVVGQRLVLLLRLVVGQPLVLLHQLVVQPLLVALHQLVVPPLLVVPLRLVVPLVAPKQVVADLQNKKKKISTQFFSDSPASAGLFFCAKQRLNRRRKMVRRESLTKERNMR